MKIFLLSISLLALSAAHVPAQTNAVPPVANHTSQAVTVDMTVTNTLVSTNSIPLAQQIDTAKLAKAFVGTDAVSKRKVAIAIGAIRTGDYGVAREALREVLVLTAMTPDQEQVIHQVLDQFPTEDAQ